MQRVVDNIKAAHGKLASGCVAEDVVHHTLRARVAKQARSHAHKSAALPGTRQMLPM